VFHTLINISYSFQKAHDTLRFPVFNKGVNKIVGAFDITNTSWNIPAGL